MGDRGEHVAADLGVIQLVVAPGQGAKRSYPGIRVDVLDLVFGERTSERPPDRRPSGAFELLIQAGRSLPPCRRFLRRAGSRAGVMTVVIRDFHQSEPHRVVASPRSLHLPL